MIASLSGDGNIDEGFEEAPWPEGTSLGTQPNGYPLHPGQLYSTDGDWIYTTSGVASDLEPALQDHIVNKRVLTLPTIDAEYGAGVNRFYHVQRLGNFLLRGYGYEPNKGRYLDLVYIGEVAP